MNSSNLQSIKNIKSKRFIIVIALFAILSFTSLSNADTEYKDEARTIELSSRLLNSTVKILTETELTIGHATGFYVGRNTILTNNHVIKDKTKISIITYNDKECSAEVIKIDVKNDMALIKTNCFGVPLKLNESYSIGQTVLIAGNPSIYDFTITRGMISGERYGFIQHDALTTNGSSGSAIVNIDGQVIGMAVTQDDEKDFLNFAIPSKVLMEFIE